MKEWMPPVAVLIFALGGLFGSCVTSDREATNCRKILFREDCIRACAPHKPVVDTISADKKDWACGCTDSKAAEVKP